MLHRRRTTDDGLWLRLRRTVHLGELFQRTCDVVHQLGVRSFFRLVREPRQALQRRQQASIEDCAANPVADVARLPGRAGKARQRPRCMLQQWEQRSPDLIDAENTRADTSEMLTRTSQDEAEESHRISCSSSSRPSIPASPCPPLCAKVTSAKQSTCARSATASTAVIRNALGTVPTLRVRSTEVGSFSSAPVQALRKLNSTQAVAQEIATHSPYRPPKHRPRPGRCHRSARGRPPPRHATAAPAAPHTPAA